MTIMNDDVSKLPKVQADFNGLFQGGKMLCLSHSDTCFAESGEAVQLRSGMILTAFDLDADEHGAPDNIVATGVVEPSPDWLQCRGSRWVLMIDKHGVRHESELRRDT